MATKKEPMLNSELAEALDKAGHGGNWLVGVWRVENGMLIPHFTTHDFPTGDFPMAAEQLKSWGTEEVERVGK